MQPFGMMTVSTRAGSSAVLHYRRRALSVQFHRYDTFPNTS